MTAWIVLAEAACVHPDGTLSMLRVGLNRVQTSKVPVLFRASLVTRIDVESTERGQHDFRIDCVDDDGKEMLPAILGTFEVPQTGGHTNMVMNIHANLPRFCRYTFVLVVDKLEQSRMVLKVEQIEADNAKNDG